MAEEEDDACWSSLNKWKRVDRQLRRSRDRMVPSHEDQSVALDAKGSTTLL